MRNIRWFSTGESGPAMSLAPWKPVVFCAATVPQFTLSASNAIVETLVHVPALDGYSLGATIYAPVGVPEPLTAALFSCGGSVPAARYARFARFMAANGVPVLVYDYRGIGASRPPTLRGFRAVHEDWSELDCGGAIEYLRSLYPRAELIGMAHSIGTLLVGGAPNVAEISRFVFICAHTGYYRDYMPKYRMPMAVLWHGVMPLLTRVIGYFPAQILGFGEDIPAGIAMQWAARRTPEFHPEATEPDATRARAMISRYQHVTGPVLVVGFTDDAFATRAGTRRLLEAFPRLRAQMLVIAPEQVGMAKIGHFGFLRGASEVALWPILLAFLRDGRSSNALGIDATPPSCST